MAPPPGRDIPARLVAARESNRAAVFLTALAATGLLAIAVDDKVGFGHLLPFEPGSPVALVLLATLYGLAAVGPWLRASAPRPRVTVRCGEGVVRVGARAVLAREVAFVSVAPAAHGASVALVLGRGFAPVFLEVASVAEAEEIARALGAPATAATLPPAAPARGVRVIAAAITAVSAWTGCLALLAVTTSAFGSLHGVGLVNVALAPFAAAFAAIPRLRAPDGETAFDAHLALHARAAGERAEAPEPRAEAAGAAALLARRDEATSAWLARLDALPREGSAYRGDVLGPEALRAVVADDTATPDARAGAARLLATRHGETAPSLVRVVTDPDVLLRVEAATNVDAEDAVEELERLGPLFRAAR